MSGIGICTTQNEWKTWRSSATTWSVHVWFSPKIRCLNKNGHMIENLAVFKIHLTHWAKRYFVNIDIQLQTQESLVTLRYICHNVSLVSYWKNIWWAKISIFSFNTHREKPEKFDRELPRSILSLKAQMKIIGEEISIKLCQNVNAYRYNNCWFNSPWLILYFEQIVAAVHLRVMWEDNPTLYYAPLFHMTKLSNNLQI